MIRSTSELFKKFPWMSDFPYMALYILRYGMDDLIPIPWVARDTESAENIYKTCIESEKDWRTLLNIKREEGELL